MNPKISVCIPTYNRSQLLPIAITSVLEQTESQFEIIVCDDGSSDDTAAVMERFLEDSRVRYIRHLHNIGKSNNMRSGFEAATGDYFIKFDDDDRLTPAFLSKTASILDAHPEVDFVGTDHWIIDPFNQRDLRATELNSQRWGRSALTEGIITELLEVVFIQQSLQIGATLFRREALAEVGYMRPNLQNCEDNDLCVRLALAGKTGYYLNDRLMEYRVHAEQQGIHRAIPYLKDKISYLESYQFESERLEKIRLMRLVETQLLLGLRLIQIGQTQVGRRLIWQGRSAGLSKAIVGMGLSALPLSLRKSAFALIQQRN
ncbi:glycosyltransferase family 2 protein [Egbenema bharatensis]|uniref:glycosyltransferase family 2 protein n=1 Tax=Egbenema bharatensis TaxID=3463334 RepID=UPI003A8AAA30